MASKLQFLDYDDDIEFLNSLSELWYAQHYQARFKEYSWYDIHTFSFE